MGKDRVCIVGSGNWGSAIARVVGLNVGRHVAHFHPRVTMWVNQETINGKQLTDVINQTHQNVKYLPGIDLPHNVYAEPDLLAAVEGCSILIVVVPHQFVESVCKRLTGKIQKDTKVISLVKGLDTTHGLSFFSDVIKNMLGTDVGVLMGANVADEVALGKFCETTIASKNAEHRKIFKLLFENPNFCVQTVDDVIGTELCGALKNVVAVAAGFSDGLGWGSNTKAAVIRIGLTEMRKFAHTFYKGVQDSTFFESCGVGDLLTTCYSGRNHRLAQAFVRTKKSFDVLEKEMMNGQLLQGPLTAKEVNKFLRERGLENEFPLLTAVYRISYEGLAPEKLLATQSRL